MKKPWLAALFNLVPGAGYLYLGVRKVFAWLLIAGMVAVVVDGFNPKVAEAFKTYPFTWLGTLACVLSFIAFAIDAFLEARHVNGSRKPRTNDKEQT